MSVPIITTAATLMCPHGGTVILLTANAQARAEGAPMCLATDVHMVAGCPFTLPGGVPEPCLTVRWQAGAAQTRVDGTPVLLQSSVGLCYNAKQVPQGPAQVVSVQQQAKGI
jgi:hypothetical protein